MILHRHSAERVVLALRVAHPVVGHLDAGQPGMAVEDDAEEVVGLALMPVAGGVHGEQRRDVRIGVRAGDLESDAAVVGDRQQRVERVQLPAGVIRVVHTRYAAGQFEPQRIIVTQCGGHRQQVFAADLEDQLVAVDGGPFHGRLERLRAQHLGEAVDDLVEVTAVGPRGAARQGDRLDQSAVAGGVAAALDAEHAAAHTDDFAVRRVGHRSSPLSSRVVGEARAAFSAAATASARCTPRGISAILACSARMALSSISGRGGQPGR